MIPLNFFKNAFIKLFLVVIITFIHSQAVLSQERYTKTIEADFDDVLFDLQEQVIGLGLVIEHTGHIDKMLERTAFAVTGSKDLGDNSYTHAKYLQFCSAQLTHEAIAIDPENLSICPFVLYIYEHAKTPGNVTVGYRNPDFGDQDQSQPIIKKVHEFLKKVIDNTVADY